MLLVRGMVGSSLVRIQKMRISAVSDGDIIQIFYLTELDPENEAVG
jgi:hypothetical protein